MDNLKKQTIKFSQEKALEKKLNSRIKDLGGMSVKMTEPGFPDRLILLDGLTVFAEVKDEKIVLRPTQKIVFPKLEKLGFKVFIINNEKSLNECVTYLTTTKQ